MADAAHALCPAGDYPVPDRTCWLHLPARLGENLQGRILPSAWSGGRPSPDAGGRTAMMQAILRGLLYDLYVWWIGFRYGTDLDAGKNND